MCIQNLLAKLGNAGLIILNNFQHGGKSDSTCVKSIHQRWSNIVGTHLELSNITYCHFTKFWVWMTALAIIGDIDEHTSSRKRPSVENSTQFQTA